MVGSRPHHSHEGAMSKQPSAQEEEEEEDASEDNQSATSNHVVRPPSPQHQHTPPEHNMDVQQEEEPWPSCNLGSMLTMSCNNSVRKDFTQKLQAKLRSLTRGGEDIEELQPVEVACEEQYQSMGQQARPLQDEQAVVTTEPLAFLNGHQDGEGLAAPVEKEEQKQPLLKHSFSSDSDPYFDFDIESPGSPAEDASEFINVCDDLRLVGFLQKEVSGNGPVTETEQDADEAMRKQSDASSSNSQVESGCVFSSPVSSPTHEVEDSPKDPYFEIVAEAEATETLPDAAAEEEEKPEAEVVVVVVAEVSESAPAPVLVVESQESPPQESPEASIPLQQCEGKSEEVVPSHTSQLSEWRSHYLHLKTNSLEKQSEAEECEKEDVEPQEDAETEETTRPRIQRSSSLKTGKTPPGTPGGKKIVRFADALGLDLADVRTFLDEVPNVPISAYQDLLDVEMEEASGGDANSTRGAGVTGGCGAATVPLSVKTLVPLFHQPAGCQDFLERVKAQKVCLENAFMVEDMAVRGIARVLNMDYHKSVYVRYTLDEWKTYADLQASYVQGSCDGFSDKFTFLIYGHTLDVGQRLLFALRFHCRGEQFWDSNNGHNYVFECLSSHSNPSQESTSNAQVPSPEDPWLRFL